MTPALLRELARVHWAEAATIHDHVARDRILDIAEELEERADDLQDALDDTDDFLNALQVGWSYE